VCVTEEILLAATAAAPVWERGDRVGARMAFKAAYERLVVERRQQGQAPGWRLSLGWDPTQRIEAAQRAGAAGWLPANAVRHLLPAPDAASAPKRLTGSVVVMPQSEAASTRQQLWTLRELILRAVLPASAPPSVRTSRSANARPPRSSSACVRAESPHESPPV
jgi:hypothetical protein